MHQSFIDRCFGFCGSSTFKMIAMSHTYPAPCKPTPLNNPFILMMSERHRCPHIKHQVSITLRVESPKIQMRQKCVKTAYKLLCLLNVRRKLLCMLHYVIGEYKCYTLLHYRQNVIMLCPQKLYTL